MSSRSFPVALLLAGLVLPMAAPGVAAAEGGYVGVGLGPAARIDDWPNQLRVEEEIGVFVDGGTTGFFIGFAPSQSWGTNWWVLVFPVRLGGTFELFRNSDLGVQFGATGTLGIAITDQFDNGRDPDPWFHLSFGVLARVLLLDDRLAIYLRPLGFEFGIGDGSCCGTEGVRFEGALGVQYYF